MQKAVNHLRERGPDLLESGFAIVPIGKGEKFPKGLKGWQHVEADEKQLTAWIRRSVFDGVGILGKQCPGIDIDVNDERVAQQLIEWCHKNIGLAPVRRGNGDRVLIPCTAPEGGLGPDASDIFMDESDVKHQVEIKATGQQWVAYGIHPGTGNPYRWEGGELAEEDPDFLPILTGEKINALFDYFYSIVPETWTLKEKGRKRDRVGSVDSRGVVHGGDAFENYTPPLNITTDDLRRMLAQLDPDGRTNGVGWSRVGMALCHQFEGSGEGMELFDEWSQGSVEYDAEEIVRQWPTWVAKSYSGRPITAATIVAMYNSVMETAAKEDPTLKRKGETLSSWVERFVMVELKDAAEVYDAGVPIHEATSRTLKAFKEQNASYIYESFSPQGDIMIKPLANAWQEAKDTRHFMGYVYAPGSDRFCESPEDYSGALYVNRFYFPPHRVGADSREGLDVFFKFMEHLFPIESEREWFLSWMARIVQNPGQRCFVVPINITPVTGTGRGQLFECLQLIYRRANCHDVSQDDLTGRFNAFMAECLVAVVQEIKSMTGEKKYQLWERMKSLLADTTSNVQAKGKDSYSATIFANFLMFSNNIDALPIDDVNERRIYAMTGPDIPLPEDLRVALNNWKETPTAVAALFNWLKNRDVSSVNFTRAPVTDLKRQIVSASRGDTGDTAHAWLESESRPKVFTLEQALEGMSAFSGNGLDFSLSEQRLAHILRDKGFHKKQLRIDGDRPFVWFKPCKNLKTADQVRATFTKE